MNTIILKGDMINWTCLGKDCKSNCCEAYPESSNLISLHGLRYGEIPLASEEVQMITLLGFQKKIKKLKDDRYYVKCSSAGRCPFLSHSGLCDIYENRFLSCKAYPFFLDKYTGLCIDSSCPGVGKGWIKIVEIREAIESLLAIYQDRLQDDKFYSQIEIHRPTDIIKPAR